MSAPAGPRRVFSAYMLLWTVANILRIHIGLNAGTGLVGSTMDRGALLLPALVLAAGLWPAQCSGVVPFAALLVRAVTNIAKGSFMSNSQMWATQMDAAILVALASHAASVKKPLRTPLSAADEVSIVSTCARTIRWQLSIFYLASGFWKINSSFLHPDYSCASLFTVQPLEYLPDAILFASEGFFATAIPLLARLIAAIGPASTLVIEAVVPVLHAIEPRRWPISASFGVAFTLVFHMIIGLTPPPSNVSTYGVTTCTRLFFVMPDALTAALNELRSGTRRAALLGGAMIAAAAAPLALVAPFHIDAVSTVQGEGPDWHMAYYAALMIIFGRALLFELAGVVKVLGPPHQTFVVERQANRRLVSIALLYAFGLPMLGLQEKAGCLMFSQLRLHGGSNHYLLPTSLLQRWLVDAHPSSAFAGGVVRVESTSLPWVGNTFAEHMGPRTLRLVREVAQVPAEYVWAAKATSLPRDVPPPRFRKHTLSNLGLRRLLATAGRQKDTYSLKYTRLRGAVGDEAWRTASTGEQYVVRGHAGSMSCSHIGWGGWESKCDEHEIALLSAPGSVSEALAYLLIPQPNPIIPGFTEEMHCVTWG